MNAGFDVDAVFGTQVCTDENDDLLNVYANYDCESGQVCDDLEVILQHGNGEEELYRYRLPEELKPVMQDFMDSCCLGTLRKSLEDLAREVMSEAREEEELGMKLNL